MIPLEDLLSAPEDEYHDFKQQWYAPNKKTELIKDIFSFVNTAHHKDCYLIIGVDDNHNVSGVENDDNRLNTQNLTDFLHSLPIANSHTPKVIVTPIQMGQHTVDVITIKDTLDVPVYLDEDKRPKKANRPIHAGQIFTRENDTNTAISASASDYQVERLWKKRFGLDLPVQEQYKIKLADVNNWEYFEMDKTGFIYDVDPDYCMYLTKDDFPRYKVESYALGQVRMNMSWYTLTLKYRDRTIKELLVVAMDGGRFMTVTPALNSIDKFSNYSLTFQYYLAGSLDFAVEKLILKMHKPAISPDYGSRMQLLKRIVIFQDYEHLNKVTADLNQHYKTIKQMCTPTDEQLNLCKGALSMDFKNDDPEMQSSHIEQMCRESNVSQLINNYLETRSISIK
ncbi:AlbA family DNA-binding domain-containing protein [[Lactobacillus] timonensis]|uniref:AlbA family DNA-binding domain-containing protein n=1 Tax=[Lactobacillus] timonensis TaxID=1970790 RepID=UPI000C8330E1|nr:ATP-binding protein [[Lactobacillus] timonensis]